MKSDEQREKHAAYMREYMKNNPVARQKKRDADTAYREVNRAKIREYMREYYQKNRQQIIDDVREHSEERRGRIKKGEWDKGIGVITLRKRDGDDCHICGGLMSFEIMKEYNPLRASLDHVIPVSKGGTHTWGNVKLAHLRCNFSKGAN